MTIDPESFRTRLGEVVGAKYVLTAPADVEPYGRDWRGRYSGKPLCVVFPANAQEVAALVRLCGEVGAPVVPQAGNTGLTGGAIALGPEQAVIVNVSRLNKVVEIDALNNSVTVQAGCILADLRSAVEAQDRLFPMLLGAVGSCEVGGLVSTNAGGTSVLRYGNMRELVLGLEVVLPDGRIWNGLRALRKDNAGYDLKQMFIGAEGTLGIVTAAVLKLFPRPTHSASAMVCLGSVADAVRFLHFMQAEIGNRVEAFEIMSRSQLEVVLKHRPGLASPVAVEHPWYVLVEIADTTGEWDLLAPLEKAMEAELILDAAVATDLAKAERIWELRHSISEANKHEGFTCSNDTSVPISKLPEFIARVDERLAAELPAATVCHVGHVGDGNIHVIVLLPRSLYTTPSKCEAGAAIANGIVHEVSVELGGSISAEHGVGLMHVERLVRFKPALDIELMRTVKAALDPKGIMNPGKIVAALR